MRFISAFLCLCCACCQMATAQEPLNFAAMAQRQSAIAAAPVAPLDFGAMAERRPVMQAAPVPALNFEAMRERAAPVAPTVSTMLPCVGPNCPTPSALNSYQTGGKWVTGLFGKPRWKPHK